MVAPTRGACPITAFKPFHQPTDEQRRRLDGIWLEITRAQSARVACEVLVHRLAELLNIGAAILQHSADGWTVMSESGPADLEGDRRLEVRAISTELAASGHGPAAVAPTGSRWTGIPIGEADPPGVWVLLLPGEPAIWRAAPWFEAFVREVSLALQLVASMDLVRQRGRLLRREYAFTRRLAQMRGPVVHQLIVDTIAKAVGAQIGSLALAVPEEETLRIAATRGYPMGLVQHVRIAPGVGVLGSVFLSRQPLLVADVTAVPGRPRPRYQTKSFMAVPLISGDTVLGVVAVTDRLDGRPFARQHLTIARTLMAPAALTLVRERITMQASELARATSIDPLTGLTNRREFQNRLEEELERARRHSLDLALLMIDLDGFKTINDTKGHIAGDAALQAAAKVLQRSVRKFDVCARYGGDEFAIITPGSTAPQAVQHAERIRRRIGHFQGTRGEEGPALTASIGVAVVTPGMSSTQLISLADRALYRAKAEGRNCVRLAEQENEPVT
jgi:diguanylate cyclase (GGDEF)-like protein